MAFSTTIEARDDSFSYAGDGFAHQRKGSACPAVCIVVFILLLCVDHVRPINVTIQRGIGYCDLTIGNAASTRSTNGRLQCNRCVRAGARRRRLWLRVQHVARPHKFSHNRSHRFWREDDVAKVMGNLNRVFNRKPPRSRPGHALVNILLGIVSVRASAVHNAPCSNADAKVDRVELECKVVKEFFEELPDCLGVWATALVFQQKDCGKRAVIAERDFKPVHLCFREAPCFSCSRYQCSMLQVRNHRISTPLQEVKHHNHPRVAGQCAV